MLSQKTWETFDPLKTKCAFFILCKFPWRIQYIIKTVLNQVYNILYLYSIISPGINKRHSILLIQNIKYSNKLYPILNKLKYKNIKSTDILISITQEIYIINLFILNIMKLTYLL